MRIERVPEGRDEERIGVWWKKRRRKEVVELWGGGKETAATGRVVLERGGFATVKRVLKFRRLHLAYSSTIPHPMPKALLTVASTSVILYT